MPRVSEKRKAVRELNCQKSAKKHKQPEVSKQHEEAEPVPGPSTAASSLSPPTTPHMFAAGFRHSLLQEEKRETKHFIAKIISIVGFGKVQ